MKIFLLAYTRLNLGDDLFIKILLERNKNHNFYIKIKDTKYLNYFSKYPNLHILIGDNDYLTNIEEYDAYVYIGGSIFMENLTCISPKFLDFLKHCKEKNIPFFFISSNFGPYESSDFFDLSKEVFSYCTDISFRDKYSYNLFKDLDTVRYVPDIVFSYDLKAQNKIPNSIGISIINLDNRSDLKHLDNKYFRFLLNNIQTNLQSGKKVYLYSFCEYQGDGVIIDKIINHFKNNPDIISCKYKGNIDEFLNLYSQMEYMICTRFHSMVLSSLFKQKVFVLSYTPKIDNVINGLNLDYNTLNFKDIDENFIVNEKYFSTIEDNNLSDISDSANNHFKILNKFLAD